MKHKKDPQKKTALEQPVNIFLLGGLNLFYGTNLTLISDVLPYL